MYEELRRIQREEREREGLTKLADDFFEKVKEYLSERERQMKREAEGKVAERKVEEIKAEIENAKKVFKKIFEIRARKILNQAVRCMEARVHDTSNMIGEEEQLYFRVLSLLKEHMKEVEEKLEGGNMVLVRILDRIGKFQWEDEIYGPYEKEDVVTLPKQIAKILINKGKAERL